MMAPPVALGSEDKAWLTPGFVRALMADASLEDAFRTLVRCVHFNPASPQHMNVYTPAASVHQCARCTQVFTGQGWVGDRNNNDVASHLACSLGRHVVQQMAPAQKREAWGAELVEFVENLHRDYGFAQQVVALASDHAAWVAFFHPEVLAQHAPL
jgi:hypothetical protein